MDEFEHWWRDRFGGLVPVGYVLREHLQDRWFRIHSLPGSKRWPTQESEYGEMLHRHNATATDVLGVGSNCWLVAVTYIETEIDADNGQPPVLPGVNQGKWHKPLKFREPPDPQIEDDVPLVTVCWPTQLRWIPGQFDALIRMVADDKGPRLIFVESTRSRVYAPYDGGADLLESVTMRDSLRARYTSWLSSHPRGL